MTTRGERGPTGDHGQRGDVGQTGAVGPAGKTGLAGRNVLTREQTLALFGFLVFAFVLLAYRSEYNADNIQDGVVKHDKFVEEVCSRQPNLAPQTCLKRE